MWLLCSKWKLCTVSKKASCWMLEYRCPKEMWGGHLTQCYRSSGHWRSSVHKGQLVREGVWRAQVAVKPDITFIAPFVAVLGPCSRIPRQYLEIRYACFQIMGARWRSLLIHWDTSQKVAVAIPDGAFAFFHLLNLSDRTMYLGSTHPLTEMGTRDLRWG